MANSKLDLTLVSNDVISGLQSILITNLESIYVAGSAQRGHFVANVSDIDYYAVVNSAKNPNKATRDAVKCLEKELSKRYAPYGATSIDISLILNTNITDAVDNRTGLILSHDARVIWGKVQNLGWTHDLSEEKMAIIFNNRARRRLASIIGRHNSGEITKKDHRRLIKIGLRCAYGIAMLRGALYQADYNKYRQTIDELVPELSKEIASLSTEDLTSAEKIRVVSRIVDYADSHGLPMLELRGKSDPAVDAILKAHDIS